jgi:putative ABC transport system ATP-binding protein
VISARAIRKSYTEGDGGEVKVLAGLDLDVAGGELVAVVGPSGSGKSTLLHILGGLDVAYSGEVSVAGVRTTGLADRELARFRNAHVGFIFQSFHLVPNLSALENVLLPGHFAPGGRSPAEAKGKARALLERVGLSGKQGRITERLSGGERQRVAIARALFASPQVLLCDEPTGNLDAKSASEVLTLISRLNKEFGKTVVMVTHDPHAAHFASKVRYIDKGELLPEGQVPEDWRANPN